MSDDLKLFVVVRNDLSKSQKTVQAIHAAAEYLRQEDTSWDNGVVVCLRVDNESELKLIKGLLERNNHKSRCFFEPDMENSMTALATVQNKGFKLFSRLQLL